jgi:hypothetical protein
MKRILTLVALTTACFTNFAPVSAQEATAVAEAVPVQPGKASDDIKLEPKAVDAQARPITVTVELLSNTKLLGVLTDNSQVVVQTSFGSATIPTAEIAAVRLASKEDSMTTIILMNGDSITGATDIKNVTVDTEWGTAKINGSSIQSLFLVPEVKWSKSPGINGARWSLIDAKTPPPPPAGAPGTANPNAAPGNPNNRQPTPNQVGVPRQN